MNENTVAELSKLYREDEAARHFFDWTANRVNDSAQTTIDYLSQKCNCDYRSAYSLAQTLEALGCGRIVVGRRGHPSRILWTVSLKSLGNAAKGTRQDIQPVDPDLSAESDEQEESTTNIVLEAKTRLANDLGVPIEAIAITVKF